MEVFINGKLNHSNNFFITQRCKQYPNTNLNKYFLLDQYLKTTREIGDGSKRRPGTEMETEVKRGLEKRRGGDGHRQRQETG